MKTGFQVGLALVLATCAAGVGAGAQASANLASGVAARSNALEGLPSGAVNGDRIIRVIEDDSLGNRWALCRDPEHAAGPGRLVLIGSPSREIKAESKDRTTRSSVFVSLPTPVRPIIRPGDRVIVEEHSPVADMRLAAVALESAVAGSSLHLRFEIGGIVLRAVAVSAGHATLLPEVKR